MLWFTIHEPLWRGCARISEGLTQEVAAEAQSLPVNAVSDAL